MERQKPTMWVGWPASGSEAGESAKPAGQSWTRKGSFGPGAEVNKVGPRREPRHADVGAWRAALLAGADGGGGVGWFIFGFISEPSAVGRILAVCLVTWIRVVARLGASPAPSAPWDSCRRESSGRAQAWISCHSAMTLTGVGR